MISIQVLAVRPWKVRTFKRVTPFQGLVDEVSRYQGHHPYNNRLQTANYGFDDLFINSGLLSSTSDIKVTEHIDPSICHNFDLKTLLLVIKSSLVNYADKGPLIKEKRLMCQLHTTLCICHGAGSL